MDLVPHPTFTVTPTLPRCIIQWLTHYHLRIFAASWPHGTYGFPEPREGCPPGFTTGCRKHDSEDWFNKNKFTNAGKLNGTFSYDITICYCVKTSSGSSSSEWPAGRYCINRVGGICPLGFASGSLFWDDETLVNRNGQYGRLPDGDYGMDTKMYYCCRNDGPTSTAITLPTANSFVLYQHISSRCQEVSGMSSSNVTVKFDTEDYGNKDQCITPVPFNPNCGDRNHILFMCYYRA